MTGDVGDQAKSQEQKKGEERKLQERRGKGLITRLDVWYSEFKKCGAKSQRTAEADRSQPDTI